jgi:hypothetical protein
MMQCLLLLLMHDAGSRCLASDSEGMRLQCRMCDSTPTQRKLFVAMNHHFLFPHRSEVSEKLASDALDRFAISVGKEDRSIALWKLREPKPMISENQQDAS